MSAHCLRMLYCRTNVYRMCRIIQVNLCGLMAWLSSKRMLQCMTFCICRTTLSFVAVPIKIEYSSITILSDHQVWCTTSTELPLRVGRAHSDHQVWCTTSTELPLRVGGAHSASYMHQIFMCLHVVYERSAHQTWWCTQQNNIRVLSRIATFAFGCCTVKSLS